MEDPSEEEIEELKKWIEESWNPAHETVAHMYSVGIIRDEDLESPDALAARLGEINFNRDTEGNVSIRLIVDYREEILELARDHLASSDHRIANVFFALWLEHTLNLILDAALRRRGLDKESAKDVLKDTTAYGKTSWLPQLCDLPPIDGEMRRTIRFLFDERNGFVHYKFPAQEPGDREADTRARRAAERADDVVLFMQAYEKRALYRGNRERVKDLVDQLLE